MHRYQCRQTPPPSPINHRSVEDQYTDYVSHIEECTDTSADRPHPLLQLTIDVWKTTTPTKFHISKNAQIPVADLPPFEHRSLEHHYTEEGTDSHGRPPPTFEHR